MYVHTFIHWLPSSIVRPIACITIKGSVTYVVETSWYLVCLAMTHGSPAISGTPLKGSNPLFASGARYNWRYSKTLVPMDRSRQDGGFGSTFQCSRSTDRPRKPSGRLGWAPNNFGSKTRYFLFLLIVFYLLESRYACLRLWFSNSSRGSKPHRVDLNLWQR